MFEAMVPLPRSMTSSLLALPRSCHDFGKDTMAMQDRVKANHDLGKGPMEPIAKLLENSELLFSNYN